MCKSFYLFLEIIYGFKKPKVVSHQHTAKKSAFLQNKSIPLKHKVVPDLLCCQTVLSPEECTAANSVAYNLLCMITIFSASSDHKRRWMIFSHSLLSQNTLHFAPMLTQRTVFRHLIKVPISEAK